MLRISRLTDYGTVVLGQMADTPDRVWSAADLAARTGIAQPTVSKLLKSLARPGLLRSWRGASGGYALARPPAEISAADILDALEGPLRLTECADDHATCEFESVCRVGGAWQAINGAIRAALGTVTLEDLIRGTPDLAALGLREAVTGGDDTRPIHFRPLIHQSRSA